MICRNCGKELPAESRFCPYCMTKFGEEKAIKTTPPTKKKPNKAILIICAVIVAATVIASAVCMPIFLSGDENNSTDIVLPTNKSAASEADNKNKTVNDSEQGFNLTNSFFDSNFLSVSHDQLLKNEDVYRSANIRFECIILKDEGETVFAEYGATLGFDGIYSGTGNYVALTSDSPVADLSYSDSVVVYGTFDGVATYNVGGKDYTMPRVKVKTITDFVYFSSIDPVYSYDEILAKAKEIFGKDATVRESVRSDFADRDFDEILMDGGLFYTVQTDYGKYCMFAGEGSFIYDCSSAYPIQRYVLPVADSDDLYFYTVNEASRAMTLSRYDKNMKLLWEREFENSYSFVMDYTSKHIYLAADTNLYIIDANTGKDTVKPQYVGSKCALIKLKDSLILVSPTGNDNIMFADTEGNVIRTVDLPYDIPWTDSDRSPYIQPNGSDYLISYEAMQNGVTVGTYTALVTADGKISYEYLD